MPYRIPEAHVFPDPQLADDDGLLGVGGDLNPARVALAYQLGIFPWYSEGLPILWWSPDPRLVLLPSELRVSRSLEKRIRNGPFRVTADRAFADVIHRCAAVPRPGQSGTWITQDMLASYIALHEAGRAHSVEAWVGDVLVGGVYGVVAGAVFCGESMFSVQPDASKVAFVALVRSLARWGCPLIDCQVRTEHLARFGAREVPRTEFLERLADGRSGTLPGGPWSIALADAQK